ncbi:MAG: hypothetical protein JW863_06785 [Chitinispirillaceae bacterium]|nr:hypothetical protein [Chitinispirillaceae bacterium]
MKPLSALIILIAGTLLQIHAMDGKTVSHLITIPVIEGAGIYTSVQMIRTGQANSTAAAITNLALIGVDAGIGAYTLFGKPDNYGTLRMVHRIAGMVTGAAAIWLTTSAWLNSDMKTVGRGVSTGYSVMTVVPVILFSF